MKFNVFIPFLLAPILVGCSGTSIQNIAQKTVSDIKTDVSKAAASDSVSAKGLVQAAKSNVTPLPNKPPRNEYLAGVYASYADFIKSAKLSQNTAQVNLVKQVGDEIRQAVEKHYADIGKSKDLEGYAWEFNLVEGPEVNAWCMPGGKVVVFTGIMPTAKNRDGLAVIMGHEIAHAIARHREKQQGKEDVVGFASDKAADRLDDSKAGTVIGGERIGNVIERGAKLGVLLPFSRKYEYEADELGLTFMAMAGFNPKQAPEFWERMSALSAGAERQQFFSTHPSDTNRIKNLNEHLPEAMKYYSK